MTWEALLVTAEPLACKVPVEKPVEKKTAKKVKENVEKTTLGDISALSDLKSEMEENERNKKK